MPMSGLWACGRLARMCVLHRLYCMYYVCVCACMYGVVYVRVYLPTHLSLTDDNTPSTHTQPDSPQSLDKVS